MEQIFSTANTFLPFLNQFHRAKLQAESILKSTFIHSHKKRKDSVEARAALLVFLLELEIYGVTTQEIHQNGKIVTFVSNCSVKMTLKLF